MPAECCTNTSWRLAQVGGHCGSLTEMAITSTKGIIMKKISKHLTHREATDAIDAIDAKNRKLGDRLIIEHGLDGYFYVVDAG